MNGFQNLNALVALSEERHFGRASSRLALTQSAFSRRIQALEAEIGLKLVNRTTRHVTLTAAGERLVVHMRDALDRLDAAILDLKSEAAGLSGLVRIGYNRIALHGRLIQIVRRYKERFPAVQVDLLFMTSHEQITSLLNGTLDLGFVVGPATPELSSIVIQRDKLVAVLPEDHKLARGKLSLCELSDQPFVFGRRADWRIYRQIMDNVCIQAGFTPNVVQEGGTTEAVLGFVALGIGVTLYLRAHGPFPGVIYVDLTDCETIIETALVWRPDEKSPLIKKFLAEVRDTQ